VASRFSYRPSDCSDDRARNRHPIGTFDSVSSPPYIVVLGGSAGGFAVVETILRALPEDIPAAICVVLHLQPSSESWLPQRLARCTKLPVLTPHDELLKPAHIYTAIPDYHLIVKADRVILTRGPRENLWRPAIDVLFRSAAVAHSTRVIGVILSGELDDGTSGLQAIATCGGVTIVQDPSDAKYPTMPEVALANASIDHRLPSAEIGPLIDELVRGTPREPRTIPEHLRKEVEMAEGDSSLLTPDFVSSGPSAFTCPECQGPLWQRPHDHNGFRCLVGHAYEIGSLLRAHDEDLDRTLWAAIRSFEQRANIAQTMSDQAQANGFRRRAELHAGRAAEARAHAARLRQLQGSYRTTFEEPGAIAQAD
jgi:two-component system, chemotaxis family, protein-glutamate methylesterase/glutaminase